MNDVLVAFSEDESGMDKDLFRELPMAVCPAVGRLWCDSSSLLLQD